MSTRPTEPTGAGSGSSPQPPVVWQRERVLGDAEVARILDTAADLQERSETIALSTGHGLTLEQLRQVAREAGIDPRFVDIAAAQGRGPVGRTRNLVLGGPQHWRFHSEVPGELSRNDRARLVHTVRSAMQEQGEVVEVYGRLEWRRDDTLGPVTIGISPKQGVTEIDVSANRRGEAGLLFGLGVPLGGLLGGSAVAGLIGVAGTGAAWPVAAAMAGVSYGLARLGWRFRSAWWERRLQQKVDDLSSTVQNLVFSASAQDDSNAEVIGPTGSRVCWRGRVGPRRPVHLVADLCRREPTDSEFCWRGPLGSKAG